MQKRGLYKLLRIPHLSCSSWRAPTQKSSRHRFFLPTQAGLQQSFFKVDWTIDPLTRKTQTPTCIKLYYFFDISSLFLRRQNSASFLHGRDTKIIDTSFAFFSPNKIPILLCLVFRSRKTKAPWILGMGVFPWRLCILDKRHFYQSFFCIGVFTTEFRYSLRYHTTGLRMSFFGVLSSSSQEAGTSHMIQKSYHGCHGSTNSSTKILLDI